MEPDNPDRVGERPNPWDGLLATHRWLTDRRERIEAVTGAAPTFSWLLRMDPGISQWLGSADHVVQHRADVIGDIVGRGETLGLHVHPWTRRSGTWIDDYSDPTWVDECIDTAFDAYRTTFGRPCRVTSMGAGTLTERSAARLDHHDVVADLTVKPARTPIPETAESTTRGTTLDTRRTPRRPYRPGVDDVTVPSRPARNFWEIPLSASRRFLGVRPHAHLSRLRRHGLNRLDLPLEVGRACPPGDSFGERVHRSIRGQRRPYLAFAQRSDGLITPQQQARLDVHLEALLAAPFAPRLAFVAPDELIPG